MRLPIRFAETEWPARAWSPRLFLAIAAALVAFAA